MRRIFMEHPAGPFTVFFWCPLIKWGIVLTNMNDFRIPTKQISTLQQFAIMLSGMVWTRYCLVITPVNYSLALVNLFLSISGCYQLYRKQQDGSLIQDFYQRQETK